MRSGKSFDFAAKTERGEIGLAWFITGQTRSHKPQFTQSSRFTFGYKKPSTSAEKSMQRFGQTCPQASQPQHSDFVLGFTI